MLSQKVTNIYVKNALGKTQHENVHFNFQVQDMKFASRDCGLTFELASNRSFTEHMTPCPLSNTQNITLALIYYSMKIKATKMWNKMAEVSLPRCQRPLGT